MSRSSSSSRPQHRLILAAAVAILALTASAPATAAPAATTAADKRACAAGTATIPVPAVLPGFRGAPFCLPIRYGPAGASRVDSLYSSIAGDVIRFFNGRTTKQPARAAQVVCWSRSDWNLLDKHHRKAGAGGLADVAGFVLMPRNVINLSPTTCARLDRVAFFHEEPFDLKTSHAIDTLAHEALHVAGVESESFAECFSMQLTEYTTTRLGKNADYGYRLGAMHAEHWWHLHAGTEYDTSGCHDGGPLDLYPETSVWP